MLQKKKPLAGGLGEKTGGVCENFKGIVADVTDDRNWKMSRIRCKQWNCEHCAPINQRQWRAHIIDKINQIGTFDRWWFVTVTAHRRAHKAIKQLATLKNLQRGIKSLYDRLRRILVKGTDKLEYVRVYEHHKTGKFHAHFIMRGTFTVTTGELDKDGNEKGFTRWLKDNCAQVGLGFEATAKPVRSSMHVHAGFVAAYVTKYMTKSCQDFKLFPKGLRRIQCSSGFGALKIPDSMFTWGMRAGIFEADVLRHKVTDVNLDRDITTDDFEDTYIYPPELKMMP